VSRKPKNQARRQLALLTRNNGKLEHAAELAHVDYTVLHMSAYTSGDGLHDGCAGNSTPECRLHCLGNTTGRLRMENSQTAQRRRILEFWADPQAFLERIARELRNQEKRVAKRILAEGVAWLAAHRGNGNTDMALYKMVLKSTGKTLCEMFPNIQFYDYTKNLDRVRLFAAGRLPSNYHLTFSASELTGPEDVRRILPLANVAVVFDCEKHEVPATWHGMRVIDGDASDWRWLDPKGVIVGLSAKGSLKRATVNDHTRFVKQSVSEHTTFAMPLAA
jgi:hypothetical protein